MIDFPKNVNYASDRWLHALISFQNMFVYRFIVAGLNRHILTENGQVDTQPANTLGGFPFWIFLWLEYFCDFAFYLKPPYKNDQQCTFGFWKCSNL